MKIHKRNEGRPTDGYEFTEVIDTDITSIFVFGGKYFDVGFDRANEPQFAIRLNGALYIFTAEEWEAIYLAMQLAHKERFPNGAS